VSDFDVIVVGGGLIGASIAFELACGKRRVLLLDRQEPGREASWAAAGMLSPGPDAPDAQSLVPLAKKSLELYPDFVAAVERASAEKVAFAREGTLEVFHGADAEARRDSFLAQYAELGIAGESLTLDSALAMEPALNPKAGAAAWIPGEATVDPRALTEATLRAVQSKGVEIRGNCAVSSLLIRNGRCSGVLAKEQISSDHVVIAAGAFCVEIGEATRESAIGLSRYAPTHPVRGQMMAVRSKSVLLKKVLRSDAGYIVPRADGRIVCGSTLENAGFEKATTSEGLKRIHAAAVSLAPGLGNAAIVETWAGLRPGSPDHLPIIGPTDIAGLLIATGHYRNGILLAPVTAKLIQEWIVEGSTSMDVEKFSPMRFAANTSRGVAFGTSISSVRS
jgi:glycine oxidase